MRRGFRRDVADLLLRRVLNSLWQRLRAGNQRERQRKDEAAKEQFLLEHEAAEREKKRLPGIEPIRKQHRLDVHPAAVAKSRGRRNGRRRRGRNASPGLNRGVRSGVSHGHSPKVLLVPLT